MRAAVAALATLSLACAGPRESGTTMEPVTASRATLEASVEDTTGTAHTLAGSLDAGRRVALIFWQPWCGGCKSEAPHAGRAQAAFAGTMDFFGVVSGPTGAVSEVEVLAAIEEWPITYTTLRDRDLVLTEAFEVEATPTIVILEPDGTVIYREHVPPQEWPE